MFKEKKRENKAFSKFERSLQVHFPWMLGRPPRGRRRSFSAIEGYQRSRSYESAGT